MWERSYGMVTIDQICQQADVKKGSFYYFYQSKTELTLDALETYWKTNVQEKMDTVFSPSKNGVDRLLDHADIVYEKTLKLKAEKGKILACCLFTVGQEMCNVDQDLRNMVNDLLSRIMRYFSTAVRDAVSEGLIQTDDVEATAACLFSCYEGMFSRARIANDPEVMKDLKASYQRILGLKTQLA
ncbi:TetR family transcriptional regulator [Cerasicoccus arenae]|uniref:TetR family transcriptional regulator n=2 Tax=Cerasicoccus arenae TaxID=424488 RepID=A0A8J3GE44_9BACT|nr:TetR family transcriptional regulator [Cerasicoccus arenae]